MRTLTIVLLSCAALSGLYAQQSVTGMASINVQPASNSMTLNHVQLLILYNNGIGLSGQPQSVKSTKGNLIVVSYIGGPDDFLDGVTDNKGNTYVSVGTAGTSEQGGECWIYYAANATPGVTQMTFNTRINSPYDDANIYDISGASTSPLDNATNISNQDETKFGAFSGPSIKANTSGGIVIANVGITSNHITSVSAPFVFDPQDQDNGWAHVVNTASGTTYTPKWTANQQEQPGGVNFWGGVAAAFKAASAP